MLERGYLELFKEAIARPGQLPEVAFCEATRSGKLPALPRKRDRLLPVRSSLEAGNTKKSRTQATDV